MSESKKISQDDGFLESRAVSLSPSLEASMSTSEGILHDPLEPVRAIVRSFIQRASPHDGSINFEPPPTDELEEKVSQEFNNLNIDLSTIRKSLPWACQIAQGLYPFHPMDVKVLIAMISIVFYHTDDNLSKTPEVLYAFQLNLLTGRAQSDPLLECLSKVLIPRVWEYYHPLAANAICIGLYELIQGTVMELIANQINKLHPSAPEFPNHVRLKAGVPVIFAYFLFYKPNPLDITSYIQIIPDFSDTINWINDILSFYKEEIAGEDDNFVHMRATISGKSVVAALDEICEETLLKIDRISKTLSETPEHLDAFNGFVTRCIGFHASTARYRLKELMITEN